MISSKVYNNPTKLLAISLNSFYIFRQFYGKYFQNHSQIFLEFFTNLSLFFIRFYLKLFIGDFQKLPKIIILIISHIFL